MLAARGSGQSDRGRLAGEVDPTGPRWSWRRDGPSVERAAASQTEPSRTPRARARAPTTRPTEEVTGRARDHCRQRYGFLRLNGLEADPGDVYVSASQVRRCELRPGDEVAGPGARAAPRRAPPRAGARRPGERRRAAPAPSARTSSDLPAVAPEQRLPLDGERLRRPRTRRRPAGAARLRPAGAGPRRAALGPDDAPARARQRDRGRRGHRADRAADRRAPGGGDRVARGRCPAPSSPSPRPTLAPGDQVRLAELALERARRHAEAGADAVLLVDSLSRLRFAAGDVAEVKRLFGSGRDLAEERRHADRVATTLADARTRARRSARSATTESAADHARPRARRSRRVPRARRRASAGSRTRRSFAMPEELEAIRQLRALLADLGPAEAAAACASRSRRRASNAELLKSL